MTKLLAAAAALAAIAAAPALAADLPYGAPYSPAPAYSANWTGFYIGAGLGGRFDRTDWSAGCLQPATVACPGGNALFPSRFGVDNPSHFDSSSARISGYAGYNWQLQNFLVGVEGDFGYGFNSTTHNGISGTHLAGLSGGDLTRVRDTWDASARARLGYVVSPQALVYVTGGASWISGDFSASCVAGSFALGGWCAAAHSEKQTDTRLGWTVGAGAEWRFTPQWIARAEYRYSDYGKTTYSFFTTTPADSFTASIETRTHTVYAGVSYLFGAGR
jgi:outer membrane immunogenic protein